MKVVCDELICYERGLLWTGLLWKGTVFQIWFLLCVFLPVNL